MKFDGARERIEAVKSELSGSQFDDVNLSGSRFHNVNMSGVSFDDINMSGWTIRNANLSGWKVSKVNLAGASFSEGRYDGMTIDGIAVTDLLDAYHAARQGIDEVADATALPDELGALMDRFAAMEPAEQRRQIDAANAYLDTAEGRAEFGLPPRQSRDGQPASGISRPNA